MQIDEIYLGAFAAIGILGAVFGITLVAIDSQDFGAGRQSGLSELATPSSQIAAGRPEASGSEQISYKDLNPEQVLAKRYEQSAKDEVQRCLDSGGNMLPPMCDYTMDLLIESCKDPDSYVKACDDNRLLEYSTKYELS